MDIPWPLPVTWLGLGLMTLVCSLRASKSRPVFIVGLLAVSALWVAAGAGANAFFLLRGDDYSGFADAAPAYFVRSTWEGVVVPRHGLFIGLLIVFEAAAGLMVLARPVRQTALLALIAFNAALLSFGWGYLLWSVPMVIALSLMLRADRAWHGDQLVRTRQVG